VRVPPLRDRTADIPILTTHFLQLFATRHKRPTATLSAAALDHLIARPWPGNVRELKNVVERLVVRTDDPVIDLHHVHSCGAVPAAAPRDERFAATGGLPPHLHAIIDRVFNRGESFWTAVHAPFMSRDLTREDLRAIVRLGLERTEGSYRAMMALFNLHGDDYKRCLGFLTQHDCHLPIHDFRPAKASLRSAAAAPAATGTSSSRRESSS